MTGGGSPKHRSIMLRDWISLIHASQVGVTVYLSIMTGGAALPELLVGARHGAPAPLKPPPHTPC